MIEDSLESTASVQDPDGPMSDAETAYWREWMELLATEGLRELFDPENSAMPKKECGVAKTLYQQGRCVECFQYCRDGVPFVCLRFEVYGHVYTWHYPADDVPFEFVPTRPD